MPRHYVQPSESRIYLPDVPPTAAIMAVRQGDDTELSATDLLFALQAALRALDAIQIAGHQQQTSTWSLLVDAAQDVGDEYGWDQRGMRGAR